jgi:hypothetical protein
VVTELPPVFPLKFKDVGASYAMLARKTLGEDIESASQLPLFAIKVSLCCRPYYITIKTQVF